LEKLLNEVLSDPNSEFRKKLLEDLKKLEEQRHDKAKLKKLKQLKN
jgi:hypothetical protein